MKRLWQPLFQQLTSTLRERVHLALTTMALHHQLAVLARSATRPQCSPVDRCVWVLLSVVWSRWQEALTIVQPGTVRRWRRQGWRHHRRWWRGRKRLGRPAIAAETRALIRRMSQENVLWGAACIQGELAKLGVRVSHTTIAKYMARRPGPPSPTWCTFLCHHALALVAGGVYAELAHRLQATSITVIQVFQRWLASWTTSGAQQSAQGDTVCLTPPSATASVPSLWAPAPVTRICVPERSPPDSQQPCHHDLAPADVPRALETANMCLAAGAMVCWQVSPFRRRQVPREIAGQAKRASWVLVLDDTGFPKQGKASVGAARQYSGTLGKVGNGQLTVTWCDTAPQAAWPVGVRLYLPKPWAEDPARRGQARVPVEVAFQTTPEIALMRLDQARAWGVPRRCVVADADDGDNLHFLMGLEARQERDVVGVRADCRVGEQRKATTPAQRIDQLLQALPR
jgi:hypothetical protein